MAISPVIIGPKKGQPRQNCNKLFLTEYVSENPPEIQIKSLEKSEWSKYHKIAN